MNVIGSDRTMPAPQVRPRPVRADGGRILVGVDGSYAAGEAVRWSARLAGATGCQLLAVHAWQPGLGDAVGEPHERAARWRRRELRAWCQPALDAGVEPAFVLREGELEPVLATLVSSRETRLAVVGHRGAGLSHAELHRADQLVRGARCPLALIPSPGGGRFVERIVLGLDGSPGAVAACRWVAWLASSCGADVVAVAAHDTFVDWVTSWAPASSWRQARAALDGRWTEPLRERGVRVRTELVEASDHLDALTEAAHRRHADAVVIGRSPGRHRRHTAAAIRLVQRCQLPVIVVPAP